MMGNKKILILGATEFSKAKCYEWDDEALKKVNIPDYELVVINVCSLDNIVGRYTDLNIKHGLEELLETKGTLVAIGNPKKTISALFMPGGGSVKSLSNYFWSPISLSIYNESGTTRKFTGTAFKEYFKNIKEWSYCFEIPPTYKKDYFVTIGDNVKNRYDKFIAGKISFYSSSFDSGDFYFLPCPTDISDVEAINFILEKFFNVFQKTPPPDWTNSIKVPGLSNIQKKMETNLKKIKQLSKDSDRLRKKESELISYREMIYETGTALEEIVRKVFTVLGYRPKPPIFKEEYIVEYDKKVGIIECKGNEKSIKRDDFRQLLEHTKEYDLDGKFEHKGILIGNAWRLKTLEERNKSGTAIFPKGKDGVIDVATRHDIALVSTIDLFKAFCNFLEGKNKADDIMKRIFSAKGVVDFNK